MIRRIYPILLAPCLWAQTIVIQHATVINLTGGPPRKDVSVVIADGRIAAVQESDAAEAPRGARVIDGSGKFLIPGLWDMHVHLDPQGRNMAALVAKGITGIRGCTPASR